jgi:hypothetical protein
MLPAVGMLSVEGFTLEPEYEALIRARKRDNDLQGWAPNGATFADIGREAAEGDNVTLVQACLPARHQ